ncbi:MAG: M20/M25/M40 family metallo-hydrolase [Clostridiales bacterium]|jgi:endoglucanase|nr:M20/M25/M40 family metallo-hydrolase [Clostridiales bacterium]
MDTKLVKEICQVVSPSGHEDAIRAFIEKEIKPYVDEVYSDALGNLIAHKKANGPKMMLASHMDQIGLMVSHIDDEGFIRFATIGGFSEYVLFNQRVVFPNGTVGVVRGERVDNMKTDYNMSKVYIDIAAKNKEEAQKKVKIGDVCVYKNETYVDDNVVISPALDDRIACYIQIEAAKRLKNLVYDTYFVFTVQEEMGLKGARTSGFSVDPEFCIAFDVTSAADVPNALKLPQKMGEGACIKIKDASLICAPEMVNFMERVAKANNIKHQFEILTQGGTDSGAVQVSRAGVVAGVVSVATRNIHTDNEMCSVSDVDDCVLLTVKMLETAIR